MLKKFLGARPKRPRLPEGTRIYAIGDVHGRIDLLDQVFAKIDAHLAAHPVVRPVQILVGDYVDRGPGSAHVIERLIGRGETHELVCLKGNHETFIFEFMRHPAALKEWSLMGGRETLMSYGLTPPLVADAAAQKDLAVAFRTVLPKSHRMFLGGLQTSFTFGGYFFVHAGVRPRVPLAQQREEDLLWIRDDFLLHEDDFGKLVVHGHTPVREVDIRSNRINIDTGAYATGRLSCLIIEKDGVEPL